MNLAFISLIFYTIHAIINSTSHRKLHHLYNNNLWVVSCILIILWSIFILKLDGKFMCLNIDETEIENYKKATRKAIFAFIIAIYAFLEITISAFLTVWLTVFYLEEII